MEDLLRILVAGGIGGALIGIAGVFGQRRQKRKAEAKAARNPGVTPR